MIELFADKEKEKGDTWESEPYSELNKFLIIKLHKLEEIINEAPQQVEDMTLDDLRDLRHEFGDVANRCFIVWNPLTQETVDRVRKAKELQKKW